MNCVVTVQKSRVCVQSTRLTVSTLLSNNVPFLNSDTILNAENLEATQKTFAFSSKNNLPFYYVSASDGTNVVKVRSKVTDLKNQFVHLQNTFELNISNSFLMMP